MKIFLLAILLLLAVAYAGKYERSERRAVVVYYSDDKCRHLEGIAGTVISNAQQSVQSSNRGTCREQLACVHNDASEDCHDARNYGANVLITFNLNRENFLISRNNGAPVNQTYDTCYVSGIYSACHYKVVREREALRRFDDDEWRHHGEHHGNHWDNDRYDNDDHWDHDDDHHGHGRPHGKPGRPNGKPGHGKPGRPNGKPGHGKPGHGKPDHHDDHHDRPDWDRDGKPDGKPGRPHGEKPGHVQPENPQEIHHGEHHEHHGHGKPGRPNGRPGHGKPDHDDHHDRPGYDRPDWDRDGKPDHRPDWAGEWDREREDDDKKRSLGKNIVEEVKVAEPVTTAQN